MTDTTSKLRALFLAALMVFSVFAGTVALSGSVAAAESGNTSGVDGPVFQGEELTVDSGTYSAQGGGDDVIVGNGDLVQVRRGILGDQDSTQEAVAEVESGSAVFSGSQMDLETGYYFLRANGSNLQGTQFEIVQQDLEVSNWGGVYYDDEAGFDDNGLNVKTDNLGVAEGSFNILVNSTSLDQSELNTVFGGAASAHGDHKIQLTVDSSDKYLGVNFSSLDLGTYDFTVESQTSNAEGTFSIEYKTAGETTASFENNVFSQEVGDNAAFTVNMENTDTATVNITDDSGEYWANLTVMDSTNGGDADDGQVTVQMNTFLAGGHGNAFSPAEGADTVNVDYEESIGDFRLATGSYDLTVNAGNEEQDVATLALNPRETVSASTIVAPMNDNFEDVSEITNGTEMSHVAFGDNLAVEVEASGVFAYLGSATSDGLNVTFKQENFDGKYGNAPEFDISGDDFSIEPDAANNRFFVVVDTDAQTGLPDTQDISAGEEYSVTFEVDGDNNPYVASGETETVSTDITFAERSSSFDLVESPYDVENVDSAEIKGSSNLAPGTTITVQALKSGDFLEQDTDVEVMDNGTWTAQFDFGDREVGEEFELSLKRAGNTDAVDAVFSDTPEWETQESAEALQAQIDELETLLNSTMDELNATESMLEQKNATIEELEQELNETGGASQELLDQKNATIAELQNQTEELNQQLADAESQLLNQTTTIADLESEVSAMNLSARKWEAEASDLQNQTESLQSMLEAKNSTISEQESTISERDSTISELESDVSDLESQIEDAQSTTASGPGFTAVLALVALMGAALLAVRRQQ
ncbi:Chromosome segregation ATPase-like protein [Halorhabdus utahensis DSM 12940]|uniref:Chromosome segregation ATPase-like protein n=1 Tax=Halorhabdus utahensis (strain DSM 12940 / JCM 11049 / AX-2) TaxID=519442 RepID=C7NV88_HALUD|nr:BGTF surface domain-containing protein [Halorhabdus utahensis]ACV11172.1 Chromosome segregation ATPase-like protein [Halorhabdus utahensis DSM 12940]